MHRQDRQNRHLIYGGSKIKGDTRLFTSAIKLGHVPLSSRSLPRTLGMIWRPVSLSGVTSGSFSISDADGDSHSFSRCGACTSTWCLMSSLLRDGCLSHLLGTSVCSSSIHPRCDQALLFLLCSSPFVIHAFQLLRFPLFPALRGKSIWARPSTA
jgi:hypothetical protein